MLHKRCFFMKVKSNLNKRDSDYQKNVIEWYMDWKSSVVDNDEIFDWKIKHIRKNIFEVSYITNVEDESWIKELEESMANPNEDFLECIKGEIIRFYN